MDFFSAMDVLASGLGAERVRLNTSASNLANAQTTRTPEGGPYRRRDPVFSAVTRDGSGFSGELDGALAQVEVSGIAVDTAPPRRVYDPGHPDAAADGYVAMPNVRPVEEMVNMITAARAYEAAATALGSIVQMAERALNLGR